MIEIDQDELRGLAAVTLVVLLVTGGNLWNNREAPPLGFTKYSNYGFSFTYPKDLTMVEQMVMDTRPSYWLGDLQGESQQEVAGIIWGSNEASGISEFIDLIFELASEQVEFAYIGDDDSMRLSGKDVTLRRFTMSSNGVEVPGLMAGWISPEGRMFVVYNLTPSGDEAWLRDTIATMMKSLETEAPQEPRELEAYWPTEEWRYAHPDEVGLDSDSLQRMVDDIRGSGFDVDNALVIKNSYVVLDEYFGDYEKDDLHIVYSCTKSVVSTLIGLAIEDGFIDGTDVLLLDLFPEIEPENLDDLKQSITLEDMLMMSAGYDARDSWLYEWEKLGDMHDAEDAVKYVMDLPMEFEPGSRFEYTNGVSHLLSCIITEKTGLSAAEYAEQRLFSSLGITDYDWRTDKMGRNWGYSSLYLTPHSMAKIGYLFLNKGEWDGEQVISENWVEEATRHRIDANIKDGYGYQWWVDDDGYYLALGYMGQFIFVFPEDDMVAVFTSSSPETFDYSIRLPERFILPAVR
ncbi:MAG: beta-lactamase family protein [Candidatus Bathyarchaeota archaeon]|nr:beta-lactamase family protein [Candidatus Bathyarchaeota archaeon]